MASPPPDLEALANFPPVGPPAQHTVPRRLPQAAVSGTHAQSMNQLNEHLPPALASGSNAQSAYQQSQYLPQFQQFQHSGFVHATYGQSHSQDHQQYSLRYGQRYMDGGFAQEDAPWM
jgi:hypothetical protein